MGKYIHYTDEEIQRWYDEYLKVKSTTKVAKTYGIPQYLVMRRLKQYEKKNGFSSISISNSKSIYTYDKDFFSRNTPESFYWAGFIAADGNVFHRSGNSWELKIGLSDVDHEHLEKFVKAIHYSGKIKRFSAMNKGKIRNFAEIVIYGINFVKDLERFNIGERKSLTITFPEWLEMHHMVSHFIRGYIDGDGSFSPHKESKYRPKMCLSMCGTAQFLGRVRYILSRECASNAGITIRNVGKISTIAYSGNRSVANIRDFLYKGSNTNIELDRKKIRAYSEWMDSPTINASIRVKSTSVIDGSIKLFDSINQIVKNGFTHRLIRRCLNGELKTYRNYTWEVIL